MSLSRHFSATLDSLHEMLHWVRSESETVGFNAGALYQIELAAEEAIVNVIQHAYKNHGGEIEISIDKIPQHQISIAIADAAEPFNPLEYEIEPREVGGLGVMFIRKCTDEVHYERRGNQNILTFIKRVA